MSDLQDSAHVRRHTTWGSNHSRTTMLLGSSNHSRTGGMLPASLGQLPASMGQLPASMGQAMTPIFNMPVGLFTKTSSTGRRQLKRPSLKGMKRAANASFGSVQTAATTLSGFMSSMSVDSSMSSIRKDALERSDRHHHDDSNSSDCDSLLLWEGLEEPADERKVDDQIHQPHEQSTTSIDFSEQELERLKKESVHERRELGLERRRRDDSSDEDSSSEPSISFNDSEVDMLVGLANDRFGMDDASAFHESYSMGVSLGQGSFGSVRRCMSKTTRSHASGSSSLKTNGTPVPNAADDEEEDAQPKTFAVKSVPLDKYDPEEIEILRDLKDCPQVVQVQEVFHDFTRNSNDGEGTAMIVMEEIAGGELLERIAAKECYEEDKAKTLFQNLLETVQFCHDRGIAHCDIKPENIMLCSNESDTDMKLVDFGFARRFKHKDGTVDRIWDMHGSPDYAAPEVFNRDEDGGDGYDHRCDIWSCGVVLYVLLGGYGPFEADTPDDMIKEVAKPDNLKFHKRYWKHISREAKILIARMLQVDPDLRCTLEEALASPWFTEEDYPEVKKRNRATKSVSSIKSLPAKPSASLKEGVVPFPHSRRSGPRLTPAA